MSKRTPIIFLDIDGVLNGHRYMKEAESCNILTPCVRQLNRVVRETGAKIVLSSAWRYMIHGKAMTLDGFAYMLRTHGFCGLDALIGLTDPDEQCQQCRYTHRSGKGSTWNGQSFACRKCGQVVGERAVQICGWLLENCDRLNVGRYVAIDDEDFGFAKQGIPAVITNGRVGLTKAKADQAIRILRRRSSAHTADAARAGGKS